MGRRQSKIIKKVKKKLPWMSHLLDDIGVALDLNLSSQIPISIPKGSKCTICKGSKRICGKTKCPILSRLDTYLKLEPMMERKERSLPRLIILIPTPRNSTNRKSKFTYLRNFLNLSFIKRLNAYKSNDLSDSINSS